MPVDYEKFVACFDATGLTLQEAGVRMGWPAATARQNFANLIKGRSTAAAKAGTTPPPAPRLDTLELACGVLGCTLLDILTADSPARGPSGRRISSGSAAVSDRPGRRTARSAAPRT